MNIAFQHSMESVEVRPLDEHSGNRGGAEEERANEGPQGKELPQDEAWVPAGEYYLG